MNYKLTTHQEEIFLQALAHLEKEDRLLIKGSAGTGKTFLCKAIVQELSKKKGNTTINCTAPTNKAVDVIRSKVGNLPNTNFLTTHSALKLKAEINPETGEISFKSYSNPKYPPLQSVSTLIVDEASMINEYLLQQIEEAATKQGTKVIFLMDDKQLPPVNQKFMSVHNYPTVQLTEIIRQKYNNPLIDLSMNLSLLHKREDNLIKVGDYLSGYVFSNDIDKIIDKLCLSKGTDYYKYIAYTNKEVDRINYRVRQKLYGDNPPKLVIGEQMIFEKAYKEYQNATTITIKNLKVTKDDSLKYYLINYTDLGNKVIVGGIKILHEESYEEYYKTLNEYKKTALESKKKEDWKKYYNLIDKYAQINYAYAITCHKAQGSTYENVIINLKDFNKCNKSEYKHLLYTGITRASYMVVFYNF